MGAPDQDRRGRGASKEPRPIAGRVPPHDLDAEAAAISACLLHEAAVDDVLSAMAPEHCYSSANKVILGAIAALHEARTPVDLVTVANRLRDQDQLSAVGGPSYLAQLADATPEVAHVAAHAAIVRDLWQARRVIAECQAIAAEGYGELGDTRAWIDAAQDRISTVATSDAADAHMVTAKTAMTGLFKRLLTQEPPKRIATTGIAHLDRMLVMQPGNITIIAARPGIGKTAFATGVLLASAALDDTACALFSMEMQTHGELDARLLAAYARTNLSWILHPNARLFESRDDEDDGLAKKVSDLATLPLFIDDTAGVTLAALRAKVRAAKRRARNEYGTTLRLIAIDYLQLMRGESTRKNQNREQEIAELSRGIKNLAGDEGLHVLLLSQLNREVEKRNPPKPVMSDLRESGSIEQDASAVLLLYRADYYRAQGREVKIQPGWEDVAEINIAKQRNGPTGVVCAQFHHVSASFGELPAGHPANVDQEHAE